MRKLLAAGGALVIVVVGLVIAGRLWAQEKKMPPVAPETKIGLVNLTHVISNCDKYKAYKAAMEAEVQPFQAEIKGRQALMENLRKEASDAEHPVSEKRRQEIETQLKNEQQAIEAVNGHAKAKLTKQASDEIVLICKDVEAASTRYAKAHDLDLVLQFNEPLDPKDLFSPANVERKMGASAMIPLYSAEGMDISKDILEILNESK
ncbi:MAG TPA: OmpH family outer membrane protein [Gemmataceae bacterium]|nr:OmpH family outer membrane protein [Gemmataceae bacterium]